MTSFIRYFVLSATLLISLTGCKFKPDHKIYTYAEELLTKGELTEATEVANEILKSYNLTPAEKSKIDSILEISYRLKKDYTLSDSDVLRKLGKYHPYMDEDDLLRLEETNKIDYFEIDGEKRYFKNCVSNLFLLDSVYSRLKSEINGKIIDSLSIFRVKSTSAVILNTEKAGKPANPVRMKLSYTIKVKADAVPEGDTIRCWMPYPRESQPRQQEVRLLSTIPGNGKISSATDLQRAIYFEKTAVAHQPTLFSTEIEFTSYAQSFQLKPEMVGSYNKESSIFKEFTSERPPQIVFNNRIKSLAKRILQAEVDPLLKVRKIYQWISDSVTWASALEYSIMPDIPGFVMEKRHGDCGMQTLLFMALARSSGIPVKWQSGWMLHPGAVNLHDWCEVWYEGIGWVPLDQSFGLQNSTDPKVRDFYVTGIDAYRLIVNDDYSQPLSPGKRFLRSEPYDFQRGELEWKGGNLYFDKWSWHMEVAYN